jgi:hypothetical protein
MGSCELVPGTASRLPDRRTAGRQAGHHPESDTHQRAKQGQVDNEEHVRGAGALPAAPEEWGGMARRELALAAAEAGAQPS